MSVLMEFTMFPTDRGESVSAEVSQIIKVIRGKTNHYQLTPMGTVIETNSFDEALEILSLCNKTLENLGAKRIYSSVKFDIRPGKENRMLSKIKSIEKDSRIEDLKSLPGVSDLAINLVNFDSKFKKAFSYVLGNTLIVDNMEVGRRIGIGKARMVSKEGDIMESSGLMQGGFRGKRKGRGFNQVEVSKKLELIENKRENKRTKKVQHVLKTELIIRESCGG